MRPILFNEQGLKECKICKVPKTKEEYYKSNTYKSGYRPECIECCGEKARQYPRTSQQVRESKYRSVYGVSAEYINELFTVQGGVCAICGLPETAQHKKGIVSSLSVDHDHKTGKVRGLLCNNCNQGLGRFKDSQENLFEAIEYLDKHRIK